MRRALLLAGLLLLLALPLSTLPAASARPAASAGDWPLSGYDTARSGVGPSSPGITAANVGRLKRRRLTLDGTVDSSPIYLHGVTVDGAKHDVLFVTTTYGRTEAIDAASGKVLWRFTPPAYARVAGTAQITNASPAADPSRTAIYAAASDGRIRKLRISDGKVLWTTTVTRDPGHEKLTSPLNVSGGLVLVTTGGYIGDAPPYQGHVLSLSAATGRIQHVWNSLCADRRTVILPSSCGASDSAIWSRNGAAVDPQTGDVVVATGNAPYDGKTNFGDSVAVLSHDVSKLLAFWAPSDQEQLNADDLDLGSTSPAFLPDGYALQGGKDAVLKLLRLRGGIRLVQTLPVPGRTDMFTEPAVWRGTWVFVATAGGTAAYRFAGGRLHPAWSNANDGTTPVVAGGLLYVAGSGQVRVYQPATGKQIAALPTGPVHWQSPIVVDGLVAMPEGNANDHATSGVLDVFRAP